MKLQQQRNVDEVIGVQKQHKFKITDGSQAIIMDSLINLYSDPIGSIVREITSNCIDANRERDLKLDKKIPMESEDDTSFWSNRQTVCIEYITKNTILGVDECMMFHDYGCGLSQKRVQDVFTTFGASTKRDNNYEIGGFGLGAKSPLAYADTFYVSSRHNGTETYYMIYRNNDNVPHMDQVYQAATDQQNGTTIIVPIKQRYDASDFSSAISNQLAYFDNIVLKNVEEGITTVRNYYHGKNVIEETDSYVITNDGADPCLLVGRVRYPINWDLLKGVDKYDFNASVAFKFKIGVLDLVPSREEIRYTPKTIELIQNAFNSVKKQFKDDLTAKYNDLTDYIEYILAISNIGSNNYRYSALESSDPSAVKASMAQLTAFDVSYKPNIQLSPSNNYNGNYGFHQIFDGISVYHCKKTSNSAAIGGETIYNKELFTWSELFTAMKQVEHMYYVQGNFNKLKSYSIMNVREEQSFVAFKVDNTKIGAKLDSKSYNLTDSRKPWEKTATFNTVSNLLLKSKLMMSYEDVEDAELDESFGDVVDNKTRRKINKMVFARDAYIKCTGYEVGIKHSNNEYKISDLQEKLQAEDPVLKAVVYAETKDICELDKVAKILSSTKDYIYNQYGGYNYYFGKQYKVLKVSKDVAKEFKDLEGFITAHEFMKSPKHLQRFITAQQIGKYIESFKFLRNYDEYNKPLYGLYCSLNKYHNSNTNSCWRCDDDMKPIVKEIMKLDIPDEVRYNMKMINKLEEVIEYSQGLDLLNHVDFTSKARKSIEDFLSLKDKMPDNQQIKLKLTAKNQNENELLSS
tara:strand:- start:141 stop:2546 length:2406 start_codon:yes stop_codon:yes gene_type:complete